MNLQIGMTLIVVIAAVVLFSWERFSSDVVALGVLLTLVLTGLLPIDKAFQGFGSDTVILILSILILTAALQRTGMVDITAAAVMRHAGDGPNRLWLAIMVTAAALGAFLSNTASVAFFLPVVFGIATKTGVSPSRFLMPLAFASILTSSVTLISTSTNLVVSGMMTHYNLAPLSMFELAPVGLPISIVGLAYLYFIGRRLIPERAPVTDKTLEFGVRPYLSEIVVLPNSPLAGKTLAQAKLGQAMGLEVVRIIRDKDRHLPPHPTTVLQEEDVLLVEGSQEDILKIKDTAGVDIKADVKLSDPDLEDEKIGLVEAIVLPGSALLGRTLKSYRFRERYGLQVLGLNHRGINVVRKISTVPIQLGDVLLIQGPRERITRMGVHSAFHILGPMEDLEQVRPRRRQAGLAVGIFVGVMLLGTFKVLPLAVAMLLGAFLVFGTRCITPNEAYDAVEWKVIILIGSMLGLGAAMEHTGTARYVAGLIASFMGPAHPYWLLGAFFVLTVLLTQPMSNQAAAVVVLPLAIQTAQQLSLDPRTFAVMIAVAASCSYLTPLEPACLMVYGPGRYRFADFLKVGSLLTLLIFVIAMVLVPLNWPLK